MKLHDDLAKYWPIFSPPSDYEGEARVLGGRLSSALAAETSRATSLANGG